MSDSSPPGPHSARRLTLRIGVTGHRGGPSLESGVVPRLRAQVDSILKHAATATARIHAEHPDAFAPEPPEFVAVSCLAAGADQILARAALDCGWRLDAILPFARDDYERDFEGAQLADFRELLDSASSVREIPQSLAPGGGAKAYEVAGQEMLNQADILLAMWDGGESRGRGGTRETIDEALRRGKTVIWIHTIEMRPPALWDGSQAAPLSDLASRVGVDGGFDQKLRSILMPG